jgi:diguanylate cyclase (GGDEF)-like protein
MQSPTIPVAARASLANLSRPIRSPAARVWFLIVGLGLVSFGIYVGWIADLPVRPTPFAVPVLIAAAAFYLGEINVVSVHFRRERHAFSLSEVPGIMGLFLLAPNEYLVAYLVGSGAALLADRGQSLVKGAFNLTHFAVSAVVALAVFSALASGAGRPGPQDWLAAFAATAATSIIGSLLVATVISLSGGAPQFQKLGEMVRFGLMVSLANTSLALLAVTVMWIEPLAAVLLAVPIGIVFLAYRAYVAEREKHERLELLYESSRILHHSPELDSALSALLDHARSMFRAERAEILLFPDPADEETLRTASVADGSDERMTPVSVPLDDPIRRRVSLERRAFFDVPTSAWSRPTERIRGAMISPLVGERGLIGAISIVNRLGEGSRFGEDDLRLLETVANQAAIALENGQLEQSLAELSRLKEQLRHQAYHDALTGLANRPLFVEEVERRLERGREMASHPVVAFLDLDDFKIVNDTLGHAIGDELLQEVAERIRNQTRPGDLAARFGGDEFAILMAEGATVNDAISLSGRLVDAISLAFPVRETEVMVGCSVGIAAGRPGEHRSDELLRNADVAMYTAKADGKRRFAVFDPTMHRAMVERHTLSSELSRTIAQDALEVHYQPIVELDGEQIVGVEALVRWRHPTRGYVDPTDMIRLAEESGAIVGLGRFVFREAARQVVAWQQIPGCEDLALSVNLSPLEMQQPTLVDEILAEVEQAGLAPSRLILEMTETAMFRDTTSTIARLDLLRSRGIRIAMDDFGTGYSSLAYLHRFPVDILKIARDFVGPSSLESADRAEGWAFARAIVALGRTLGKQIVAEGIETPSQLAMLRRLRCGLGQGYLFQRPCPAADLEPHLRRRAGRAAAAS